ncbi:MAG: response regulator [Chloroflexota bacterium]
MKAIVVEDHLGQGMVFKAALDLASFETELIQDGTRALEVLREASPDLVLMDMHLPGMRGDEVVAQLKGYPNLSETKIIVATGDPVIGKKMKGEVALVLIKPLGFSYLQQISREIMSAIKT